MNIITLNCILIFLIVFLVLLTILASLMILRWFCIKKEKNNMKVEKECKQVKESIKETGEIEFFKAIFRIIKCDSSTHYNISPEDSKLRKELIEEYLFISENFSKCFKYNPDARQQGTERCYKSLKDSCKSNNIFDDNIKPDSLDNIIKLEYLGYLFFIVFYKHLIEKYKNNPDFNKMLEIESAVIQNNHPELDYYVKYPMIVFEKHIKDIIRFTSYEREKWAIDLCQIDIGLMRQKIQEIEFPCNYGGNYCFSHFRYYYYTNFLRPSYRVLCKWFESEIARIKESIEEELTDTWSI